MIRGDKASGIFYTTDGSGIKIQGETRQCVHCQFTWIHKPGSGRKFGICECGGLICGRAECFANQKLKLARIGDAHLNCVPFEYWNYFLQEQVKKLEKNHGVFGKDFQVNSGGFLLPK